MDSKLYLLFVLKQDDVLPYEDGMFFNRIDSFICQMMLKVLIIEKCKKVECLFNHCCKIYVLCIR